MTRYDIIIVGGGVAGMQGAISAAENGLTSIIIEKDSVLGGKVAHKSTLFPTFTPAADVIDELQNRINECGDDLISIALQTEVTAINRELTQVTYEFLDERNNKVSGTIQGGAILLANGYTLFDATLRQEYGYKIYDNVITSIEMEEMMKKGAVKCSNGKAPENIAIIHCIGSRDSKVGNEHCSRVCCVTGVKQAMELTSTIKGAKVFNFYMDIRMFGTGYEEMYKDAQEKHQVRFIRGKVSEVAETIDGKLRLKAEDTLIARPLTITVDMVVLLVGMCEGESNRTFAKDASLTLRDNGFIKGEDAFSATTRSGADNIFLAGCVESPKNISESINQAAMAVLGIKNQIKRAKV